MSDIIGVAWFPDEATYDRAISIFADPENMPGSFEEWRTLVGKECELIAYGGNTVYRVDIDPEVFVDWCLSRGFLPNSEGRIAFVNHAVLEFKKTLIS